MIVTNLAMAGLLSMAGSADPGPELFEVLDTNQDGFIASGEVSESQQIWFTRALRVADADGDERLTRRELDSALTDPEPRSAPARRFRGQRSRRNPKELDRNKDGMITLDEVPDRAKERFQKLLDRTGKTTISVAEMTRAMGRDKPSRTRDRKSGDRKPPEMKESGRNEGSPAKGTSRKGSQKPGKGRSGRSGILKRFDKNNDGRLSKVEAPERMRRNFDRIDTNGDGNLTRSELEAAAKRRDEKSKVK